MNMESAADTGAYHLADTTEGRRSETEATGSFSSGFSSGFDIGEEV